MAPPVPVAVESTAVEDPTGLYQYGVYLDAEDSEVDGRSILPWSKDYGGREGSGCGRSRSRALAASGRALAARSSPRASAVTATLR